MSIPAVLTASWRMRMRAIPLFAIGVFFGAVTAAAGKSNTVVFVVLGLVVTGYFVALAVQAALEKWRVDDEGVAMVTPMKKGIWIAWRDLVSLSVDAAGAVSLYRSFAGPVVVPGGLVGIEELWRLALEHAPDSSIPDSTREALEQHIGRSRAVTAVPVAAPEPVIAPKEGGVARWAENPFFVLGLSPECSRAEVERTGQKLLALLGIDSGAARRYPTPFGDRERTADLVRAAMAELRDPERRLVHEAWGRIEAAESDAAADPLRDPTRPWPAAMRVIGWKVRP